MDKERVPVTWEPVNGFQWIGSRPPSGVSKRPERQGWRGGHRLHSGWRCLRVAQSILKPATPVNLLAASTTWYNLFVSTCFGDCSQPLSTRVSSLGWADTSQRSHCNRCSGAGRLVSTFAENWAEEIARRVDLGCRPLHVEDTDLARTSHDGRVAAAALAVGFASLSAEHALLLTAAVKYLHNWQWGWVLCSAFWQGRHSQPCPWTHQTLNCPATASPPCADYGPIRHVPLPVVWPPPPRPAALEPPVVVEIFRASQIPQRADIAPPHRREVRHSLVDPITRRQRVNDDGERQHFADDYGGMSLMERLYMASVTNDSNPLYVNDDVVF